MLALLMLTACAPSPWGTWMFHREVTVPTGEECATTITHNFTGAAEPTVVVDDSGWADTSAAELSEQVMFGRLEQDEVGGAILILGGDALPGTSNDKGAWLFTWTGTTASTTGSTHASGYALDAAYDKSSTLRVAGAFESGTFDGTYEVETDEIARWSESDLWSEEAAGLIGEHGNIPTATYLVVSDGAGGEIAAENSRAASECAADGCALTVESACATVNTLMGQLTDFTPDDARWVEDAGQPAGAE